MLLGMFWLFFCLFVPSLSLSCYSTVDIDLPAGCRTCNQSVCSGAGDVCIYFEVYSNGVLFPQLQCGHPIGSSGICDPTYNASGYSNCWNCSTDLCNNFPVSTSQTTYCSFMSGQGYCSNAPPTSESFPFPNGNQSTTVPITKQTDLQEQATELNRLKLLNDDDFVFDFLHPASGVSNGTGGTTVAATASNFAAVIGHDIAMTVGFIEPCGINLPHFHPRATEINFIVEGEFEAGFFSENGGKFVGHTLKPGMATVFPKGVIHFEVNMNCERAVFVAAFNNQDPGVTTIASAFFGGLPATIAGVSLGNLGIEDVEDLKSRLQMNPGSVTECRTLCGLD